MTPSLVGFSARKSGARPSWRNARAGLGPRVILRVCARASMNVGSIPNRRAVAWRRSRPSPVSRIRSSNGASINRRSQATIGVGSATSRIATSGQLTVSAPCSWSIAASRSASRASSSAIRRPLNGPPLLLSSTAALHPIAATVPALRRIAPRAGRHEPRIARRAARRRPRRSVTPFPAAAARRLRAPARKGRSDLRPAWLRGSARSPDPALRPVHHRAR